MCLAQSDPISLDQIVIKSTQARNVQVSQPCFQQECDSLKIVTLQESKESKKETTCGEEFNILLPNSSKCPVKRSLPTKYRGAKNQISDSYSANTHRLDKKEKGGNYCYNDKCEDEDKGENNADDGDNDDNNNDISNDNGADDGEDKITDHYKNDHHCHSHFNEKEEFRELKKNNSFVKNYTLPAITGDQMMHYYPPPVRLCEDHENILSSRRAPTNVLENKEYFPIWINSLDLPRKSAKANYHCHFECFSGAKNNSQKDVPVYETLYPLKNDAAPPLPPRNCHQHKPLERSQAVPYNYDPPEVPRKEKPLPEIPPRLKKLVDVEDCFNFDIIDTDEINLQNLHHADGNIAIPSTSTSSFARSINERLQNSKSLSAFNMQEKKYENGERVEIGKSRTSDSNSADLEKNSIQSGPTSIEKIKSNTNGLNKDLVSQTSAMNSGALNQNIKASVKSMKERGSVYKDSCSNMTNEVASSLELIDVSKSVAVENEIIGEKQR